VSQREGDTETRGQGAKETPRFTVIPTKEESVFGLRIIRHGGTETLGHGGCLSKDEKVLVPIHIGMANDRDENIVV